MKKILGLASVGLTGLLLCASTAAADTIIKFGLSEVGPDLVYTSGIFETRDDGDAGTLGDQNTGLDFTGFLDPVLADVLSGASMTIEEVAAIGSATNVNGVISQGTTGGKFSIWNEANELLLAGELGEGVLSGTEVTNTGSFFNTEVVNYVGGSLLTYILPSPGGISLALASIRTNGEVGLRIGADGSLQDFDANGSGLVTGEPVPEPSTALLMLSGVIGTALRRRKQKA